MPKSKSKVLLPDTMLLERRWGSNTQALVSIVIIVVVVVDIATVFFSVIRKSAKTGRSSRFDGAWSQKSVPSTHPLTMAVIEQF